MGWVWMVTRSGSTGGPLLPRSVAAVDLHADGTWLAENLARVFRGSVADTSDYGSWTALPCRRGAVEGAGIWLVGPVAELCLEPALLAILSEGERRRAARFRSERDGRLYQVAHVLVRLVVADVLHLHPGQVEFECGDHGKPHNRGGSDGRPLGHSLSHSGDVVALVVAEDRRVGIDVELVSPQHDSEALAATMPSFELSAIDPAVDPSGTQALLSRWTAAEALLKGVGVGLSALGSDREPKVDVRGSAGACRVRHGGALQTWVVYRVHAPSAYSCHVALEMPNMRMDGGPAQSSSQGRASGSTCLGT